LIFCTGIINPEMVDFFYYDIWVHPQWRGIAEINPPLRFLAEPSPTSTCYFLPILAGRALSQGSLDVPRTDVDR
jgi:hypothetical protein